MSRSFLSRHGQQSSVTRAVTVIAQLVSGAAFGAGAAYLGTLVGKRFFASDPAGFGDIVAQLGGILIGYPLGVALGVWLLGRILAGRGIFWASLLGASLGVGVVLLSARLFVYQGMALGWGLIFGLGLLGGILGYHLSARRNMQR